MDKNIKKMKFFSTKAMRKVAAEHLTLFKKRVSEEGLDKDGIRFPRYSEGYIEALERDMRIKRGPRKGQRHKGLEGIGIINDSPKIAKRQFRLRNITMRLMKLRKATSDYYMIGWDGEAAMIVDANAHRRQRPRNIIDDIPKSEYNFIINNLMKDIDKQWAKVKSKTIRIG